MHRLATEMHQIKLEDLEQRRETLSHIHNTTASNKK